ncbi:mfp1 attachment factor 1, partial [Phtheirospermum japonicum]
TTAAAVVKEFSNISFNLWPPRDRTRNAVRKRLINTLSSPSILSKRYGTISHEEAVEASKIIEEEAFEVARKMASADDGGIEILQVYSKKISRRMLDKVKVRSGDSEAPSVANPVNDEPSKAEEEDARSTAPPQSEKIESVADDK